MLSAAILLPLGSALTAGPASAAPAAHAAVPAVAPYTGIFGPCNSIEDGEVRDFGGNLYECVYVAGLGFYWVGPIDESCSGTAPARASRPAHTC